MGIQRRTRSGRLLPRQSARIPQVSQTEIPHRQRAPPRMGRSLSYARKRPDVPGIRMEISGAVEQYAQQPRPQDCGRTRLHHRLHRRNEPAFRPDSERRNGTPGHRRNLLQLSALGTDRTVFSQTAFTGQRHRPCVSGQRLLRHAQTRRRRSIRELRHCSRTRRRAGLHAGDGSPHAPFPDHRRMEPRIARIPAQLR